PAAPPGVAREIKTASKSDTSHILGLILHLPQGISPAGERAGMVTTEPRSPPQHPREGEAVAALRARTALTRAESAEATGLRRSPVSSVLGPLLEEGAVVIAGYDEQPGRGRPTERVQIDRRVVRSVGVDFGHGKVRAVALSLLGDALLDSSVAHNDLIDWPQRRELVQQV